MKPAVAGDFEAEQFESESADVVKLCVWCDSQRSVQSFAPAGPPDDHKKKSQKA